MSQPFALYGLEKLMGRQDLYLDPSIRDWVLVPITLIMVSYATLLCHLTDSQVLVGLLRHYVTQLINSSPKRQPADAVREQ